jgi:hypothetical protein
VPSKTALWRKKASFGTHFVIMSAGLSLEAMAKRMMVRQVIPHRTIAYRVAIHRDEDSRFVIMPAGLSLDAMVRKSIVRRVVPQRTMA